MNIKPVTWESQDLSYLLDENYTPAFLEKVYGLPLITVDELHSRVDTLDHQEYRIEYTNEQTFKVIAKKLGIMDDLKSGVPRTAYQGIVTTMYIGRRVYVAPVQASWNGYQES